MTKKNETKQAFHESAERSEMGKALRVQVPRADHGKWQPVPDRRDPIDLLEESNLDRVPDLIPIRYGRMLESPFAFLRGSAALMAYDLATTPTSGIRVQVCGDCHLGNFAFYATPEQNLFFDINDFDETLFAPWEWDVKRMAASFVVAGRASHISDRDCEAVVHILARSYRTRLREYAEMRVLDTWYACIDDKKLIATADDAKARQNRERSSDKARASMTKFLYPKITGVVDGRRRLDEQPPLIYHLPADSDSKERLNRMFAAYHDTQLAHLRRLFDRYRLMDFAFKVVGVGSVGTRCYVALFLADVKDPLFLQIKQARASVLEPYAGNSEYDHNGQRIVVGQHLMQSASDIFLGWTTGDDGRHYYLRQLRDRKYSVLPDNHEPKEMARYADACGWALARAHAKGGDAAMVSGYLGQSDAFDQALGRFAVAYADQNAADYKALKQAVNSGRVQAVVGK